MKAFVLFLLGLLLLVVACRTPPNDELRVTRTEATTIHNDATGLGYGACLITAVGRDNTGLVEVKATDSWGGCPQVGSTLYRCNWKGTGFAHEIAESTENCADSNKPAFYITEEKEIDK